MYYQLFHYIFTNMKKLLLIFLLLPFFAHGQQTYFSPGIPTGSTSFTPTFRYIGTDSLVKIFIANGNRSSQVYTAAQANARFGVRGLATGTNYGAFYNTSGKLVLVPGFTTDSGTYFAFNKALYYNAPKTYSTGNPRLVLEGGNKIGLDTTLDAGVDTTLLARKIGSADMAQHSYTGYGQTIYNPTGQAYTVYHNGTSINGISGSVGALANKEINVSWNMKYDVPGKENTHQPVDSTSNSIWTGQGSNYFMLQYAKALGVPQTGVGNITILTGGSGFVDGSYNLLATGGSGTLERILFTVSGGTVVSATAAHQGFNYAVNDHLSCAGFAGFTVNVNTLFNDIWNSTGQMNFMKMDVASGSIMLASPTTVAFPTQGATLMVPHSTIYSNASISGIGDGRGLILAGNNDLSVTTPEDVQINPATAGGNTGGATLIDAGGGYVGIGSNTKQTNVKLGIAGTQAASGATGEAIRSRTQLIPTANGQVLAQVLVDPPADAVGTGALTATITTAATSLADGTYDNLPSTATTGSGSGQTWKVTVLGGNVTAIVPATAATGGINYGVGNTFTVSTVTGAVFTVASLGYTGTIDIGLEVNAFPLMLPNIAAPPITKFGTVYNTSNVLKTVTNAAGVERVMIQTDATGTSSQIPVYNSNGYLVPTAPTGSGAPVEATSPTLVTPTLGLAAATSINKVAITAPATSATLTIANGATLQQTGAFTLNNTLTANSTPTYPTGAGTLLYNPLTTTGDIMYSSSGSTASRLGIGSTNQILQVIGGLPAWQTSPYLSIASPTATGVFTTPNITATSLTTGTPGTDSLLVKNASTNVVGKISPNYYLKVGDSTSFAATFVKIYGTQTILGPKTFSGYPLTESYAVGNSISTFTPGFILTNPTPSTATGTFVQPSPTFVIGGSGYGASSSIPINDQFVFQPIYTGANPSGKLLIQSSVNGGAPVTNYTFTTNTGGGGGFLTGIDGFSGSIGTAILSVGFGQTSLGVTNTNALYMPNNAASTSGIPVQYSPTIDQQGTVWNTSGTPATNNVRFTMGERGVSGSSPSATEYFGFSLNGGTNTQAMLLSSNGGLTLGTTGQGVLKATESYLNTFQNSVASTPLADSILVKEGGLIKTTLRGTISYQHTIFTPTTGGTVALVNNQYNIINPAGALLALTVNLPSSPANNDVVYIKFTQNITTVTYGNGTVVDGITAPSAGGLTVLTYDGSSSSWY